MMIKIKIMKRVCFLFLICVLVTLPVFAQKGLHVNELFDGRYRKSPNAVEIVVTGEMANKMKLNVFHSLTISNEKDVADSVERLVVKDGVTAVDKETEYRGGKLYYGFYRLKTAGGEKGMNMYLFYLNQMLAGKNPTEKVTIIYMESRESADYIKSLIRN